MKVTILGNNSALPAYGRNPTAQIVNINEQLFLIDCGEGTQMRMQLYNIRSHKINHIFISHCHGDHYFGLVGFVSSMSLLGREKKLHIYCNSFIKKVIEIQLPFHLGFEIEYIFLDEKENELLVNNEKFEIHCFKVKHSVPTHGFLFIEKKRKRILIPEKLKELEIPTYFYSKLTDGENYVDKYGNEILNETVTKEGLPWKKYAFCADTIFYPEMNNYIHDVNLLYHESTYLQDNIEKATTRFHSTAKQAAETAKIVGTKKLIIGHFSSKYKGLDSFKEEAKSIFENTDLALEGLTFEV